MVSSNRSRTEPSFLTNRLRLTRREVLAAGAAGLVAGAPGFARAAAPQGQLTWGVHISLAPTWFDPAETPGIITPVHGACTRCTTRW